MGTTFLILACAGMASCSSTDALKTEIPPVEQVEATELPDDLKDRFKVEDLQEAPPEPVAPSPKKKGKKGEAAKPVEAEFKYPNRRVNDALWVGEKQTYELTYFGVAAGVVTLEVKPFKTVNERKVYHLVAHARTAKLFEYFYRVNDTAESYLDYEGLFSHRFHLKIDESKQTRDSLELYDSIKKETFFWDRWNHHKKGYTERKERHGIPPFPLDSLTALYYLRTRPLNDGDVYSVPVVTEGKTWEGVATVLGRETQNTDIGKKRTIKIQIDTKFEGVLKSEGQNFVWVTDDDRHHVVYLEAKVKIGKVKASIIGVEPGNSP